jgi:hypothetical protein
LEVELKLLPEFIVIPARSFHMAPSPSGSYLPKSFSFVQFFSAGSLFLSNISRQLQKVAVTGPRN